MALAHLFNSLLDNFGIRLGEDGNQHLKKWRGR